MDSRRGSSLSQSTLAQSDCFDIGLTDSLGSVKRRNILLWLYNMISNTPSLLCLFEPTVNYFDSLDLDLDDAYMKVVALACLQLTAKLGSTGVETSDITSALSNISGNTHIPIKNINMCEIFVCNKLDWNFGCISTAEITDSLTSALYVDFRRISKADFLEVLFKLTTYALVLFNSFTINPYELGLALVLISLNQFDYNNIFTRSAKKILDDLFNTYSMSVMSVKWIMNTLAEYANADSDVRYRTDGMLDLYELSTIDYVDNKEDHNFCGMTVDYEE
jgi:hypothetical protein